MHLTSGVCVAYYVFPDGPSFPTKRSTTHWLATSHPQFLYQPSQVLWPHCMCRLVHGPQSSPQCQLGLIPKKLESPACQSRHARLWAVKPNLAPLNVGLSATSIIGHRTEVSTHTHTYQFNGPLFATARVSWYQKGETSLDFTDEETVSGSGIGWAICKSAPRSRQITMPAPCRSVFYRPDALPADQPTVSKHWG